MNQISQRQLDANRRNAQLSTGPATAEGKEISSHNALRHGLRAEYQMLPGEDPAQFEHLREAYYAEFQPQGPTETRHLERLIQLDWRTRRIAETEAGTYKILFSIWSIRENQPTSLANALSSDLEACKILPNVWRYERQMDKAFHRTLDDLRAAQEKRLNGIAAVPTPSVTITEVKAITAGEQSQAA